MAELIKDVYNDRFFEEVAFRFREAYPAFNPAEFLAIVRDSRWERLAFKERMRHISLTLLNDMPEAWDETVDIVCRVAAHFGGLAYMVFPDIVEIGGLDEPELSIPALARLTPFSSSEFAIRPFLMSYPELTLRYLHEWAEDDNHHVRRLASEGSRPRLPWAMALPAFKRDPRPVLEVLEKLKADGSEYVRRSVGNCLNDISKDHPDLILETARRWFGTNADTDWVVRHGCRTLLKQCHPVALSFFGFTAPEAVSVEGFALAPGQVKLGEAVKLTFSVLNTSGEPVKLRIEYGIDFVKASGRTSRKLFKLSERTYPPGLTAVETKHAFVPITTRVHYSGAHRFSIIVNGRKLAESTVHLEL
ncbi:DNA alkylation repair protein [Paenibacillus silviterrae]|uniref:DNA alkylation repair protein n=1 Tax=Paenibacillus silviterrae TaxID=3242194 RepID=UPI002543D626|nr:DNA alkylation repair protein [Paenibacillus chinjuensis]